MHVTSGSSNLGEGFPILLANFSGELTRMDLLMIRLIYLWAHLHITGIFFIEARSPPQKNISFFRHVVYLCSPLCFLLSTHHQGRAWPVKQL